MPEQIAVRESRSLAPIPTFTQSCFRRPSLTTLVAAVLLVALIGSFTLVLQQGQKTTAIPQTRHVAHDWSLVEQLSGKGTMTFTGKHIELGHKYGWSVI